MFVSTCSCSAVSAAATSSDSFASPPPPMPTSYFLYWALPALMVIRPTTLTNALTLFFPLPAPPVVPTLTLTLPAAKQGMPLTVKLMGGMDRLPSWYSLVNSIFSPLASVPTLYVSLPASREASQPPLTGSTSMSSAPLVGLNSNFPAGSFDGAPVGCAETGASAKALPSPAGLDSGVESDTLSAAFGLGGGPCAPFSAAVGLGQAAFARATIGTM